MPRGGGICDLAAYVPAQLSGKYQFALIDSSWYFGWLKNENGYHYWYCEGGYGNNPSTAIVEALCPSAMVDNSGVLYTINFYKFSEFRVAKHTPSSDGRSISSSTAEYNLYDQVERAHGADAPWFREIYPYTRNNESDYLWSRIMSHSILSPTIAQEVQSGNVNSIYVCFLCPPRRWLIDNNDRSTEGLNMAKISKSSLGLEKINGVSFYSSHDGSASCSTWPARTSHKGYLFQPEWGACKAAFDGSRVHCFHIGYNQQISSASQMGLAQTLYYKKIDSSSFHVESYTTINGMLNNDCDQCLMFPRFQKMDNNVYFCTSNGGGFCLGYWGSGTPAKIINNSYQDHVQATSACSPGARYPSDFCIIKNGSQRIACFLGLKATGHNSDLSATYGWGNSSISWNPQHLACILYSYPIPNSAQNIPCATNLKTYPSNVIYNTAIARANGDAVNSSNTTAAAIKRLYLNTQNIVAYTSASGRNYIIYAYCYPGKTKQLYLGYAQYYIDSENHIHLLVKREFHDKNGNSFGSFTDCSRIVSMDLKNGHLWITFIRGDSNGYYCFHIMAKDLVQE